MALDAGRLTADNRLVLLGQAIKDALSGDHNQQWLADQLGLNNSQVSRLVSGLVKNVSVEQVRRVEDVLGLRPGHLFRAAGYVEDEVTPREALATDGSLTPRWRQTILSIYDAWVVLSEQEMAGKSTAGAKRAPTPTKRPRK